MSRDSTINAMYQIIETSSSERDKQAFKDVLSFIHSYTGNSETSYWYPLESIVKEVSVIAYDLDKIYRDNMITTIENTLVRCDIKFAYSFQMSFNSLIRAEIDLVAKLYEKDADGYNFPWAVETYYYDSTKTWLIYVSHEGTITFTGERIVDITKSEIDDLYLIHQ